MNSLCSERISRYQMEGRSNMTKKEKKEVHHRLWLVRSATANGDRTGSHLPPTGPVCLSG